MTVNRVPVSVGALVRAEVAKRDPAQWVVQATVVIERVIPQVWDDTQSPLQSGGVGEIEASGPNAKHLAQWDRPGVAHPLLRRATRLSSGMPRTDAQSSGVWERLVGDVMVAQLIVPPGMRVRRIAYPGDMVLALRRVRHVAARWYSQGQRACDFGPVLEDTAHVLRRVVEHDLAGWVGPRRVGVRTCVMAGVDPKCRVSPVYARGMCRPCYARSIRAEKKRVLKPVNQVK
ncbi:hypothetical protein [Stomatohabitans albus]|uniref:hypothetical protein n=1 Tax=Stomatohabitans albus TaxID=3110766 RepID=UPI00300CCF2A